MISELSVALMKMCPNLKINVYKIINRFFGESITVSGLLTGVDIAAQLEGRELGDALYIPENALREGEDTFLCGMTVGELSEKLKVEICVSENDGYEFVRSMLGAE